MITQTRQFDPYVPPSIERLAAYLAQHLCSEHASRSLVLDPELDAAGAQHDDDELRRSIVVSRLRSAPSAKVLARLCGWLERAPAALVVTDTRVLGPQALRERLAKGGLRVAFAGRSEGHVSLALLERNEAPVPTQAPADFRVLAVMPVYNEEDIISHSLRYLTEQGIDVYVLDNWSTDRTLERARAFEGRGVLGIEQFPSSGPCRTYDWRAILSRVEEITERVKSDWCVLHDADERRHGPWPGIDLRSAFFHVQRLGFNCIDHVVANYWPVDDGFDPSRDVEGQLLYYEFSEHPGHFHQRKAWKNTQGHRVSLAASAGHDVMFPERRVCPYKFLIKHYPIRSQAHGEKKVFGERKARWNQAERAAGWHAQYDEMATDARFVRDRSELRREQEGSFGEHDLVERLSGIGIFRQAPSWATPPR